MAGAHPAAQDTRQEPALHRAAFHCRDTHTYPQSLKLWVSLHMPVNLACTSWGRERRLEHLLKHIDVGITCKLHTNSDPLPRNKLFPLVNVMKE